MGDSTRADAIRGEAARLAAAIHSTLRNEREGGFLEWPGDPSAPCSQLASALALLDENVPQERVPLLLETLGSDRFLAPELFMHYFVFRALDRHGRRTHIQDLIRRYWHPMVEKRCPTVLESFVHADGDPWAGENFRRAASFCHGFSTAPLPWLV